MMELLFYVEVAAAKSSLEMRKVIQSRLPEVSFKPPDAILVKSQGVST